MAGYELIRKIKSLEEQLNALGMRWGFDKHGYRPEFSDLVAVYPLEDNLPIYSRDAELFVGTLADLERWLQGVRWARDYDIMLQLSNDKKRIRKEQDVRNRHLMKQIKLEDIEVIE